jgi:2-dehydro-3-deoxyglucarate aldolase
MNRQEMISQVRSSLSEGKPSVGSWIQIPHASIAEIMGQAGYDWIAVDLEHGSISPHQLPDLFRAIELGSCLPLARVALGTTKDCKQALDAGAGGIIIPMVSSARQLELVIESICWPPTGKRGVGFSRANLFGEHFSDYLKEAQSPIIVAQIEHIDAVDNLQEILEVPGLDAIFIGPYDLSASMGLMAQFEHPEYQAAISKILSLSKKAQIPAGIHVVSPQPSELERTIEQGYRFIAYSIDAVFLNNAAKLPVID